MSIAIYKFFVRPKQTKTITTVHYNDVSYNNPLPPQPHPIRVTLKALKT